MPRRTITKDDIERNICEDARGCWVWQQNELTNAGYPYWGRWSTLVHREAYKLYIGPIPTDSEGRTLDLDHRCNNKLCVNPYHRLPVTRALNTQLAYVEKYKQMPWKWLRVARELHNQVGRDGIADYSEVNDG